MDELLQKLTANDFALLEGLQVTGTLPVSQVLVNELVATGLKQMQAGNAAPASAPGAHLAGEATGSVNWWKLISKLDVELAEGKLILDFELRR